MTLLALPARASTAPSFPPLLTRLHRSKPSELTSLLCWPDWPRKCGCDRRCAMNRPTILTSGASRPGKIHNAAAPMLRRGRRRAGFDSGGYFSMEIFAKLATAGLELP
jgi:hypothetical protein